MSKIGFVGMGNMAKALASGFIKSGAVDGMDVYAYAPTQDKLMKNADEIGFLPMTSVTAVVQNSDIIIIACKPYQIDKVLDETRDILEKQLSLRYFTPIIEKIYSIKDEYGYAYFHVLTDKGECRFAINMGSNSVTKLSDTRLIILDVDENRFEIRDVEKLSQKEKRMLDLFL